MFQNYALFRHMTVAENIEFALRVRRMRAAERRRRRQELLRLVALDGFDERLPGQLSGGQQQRVAVARALAHKPEVLLLDEPFGALDAKIREGLRRTIREVQRELGITTILVTHDQEEAFAMADRIGVMNFGRLLEIGNPQDLYTRPATRFVATFLGAANLLLARQGSDGPRWGAWPTALHGAGVGVPREREVVAVVRPEEIEVARSREALTSASYLGHGVVEEVVFTGALERARIRLDEAPDAPILAHANGDGGVLLEATRAQFEQRAFAITPGQSVTVGVRRAHILPTPLSSFTICAPNGSAAERLAGNPLLLDLSSMRMKTRIRRHLEPMLGGSTPIRGTPASLPGTTVIAAAGDVTSDTKWLLEHGVEEILILPEHASLPPAGADSLDGRLGAQGNPGRIRQRPAGILRRKPSMSMCSPRRPSRPSDRPGSEPCSMPGRKHARRTAWRSGRRCGSVWRHRLSSSSWTSRPDRCSSSVSRARVSSPASSGRCSPSRAGRCCWSIASGRRRRTVAPRRELTQ